MQFDLDEGIAVLQRTPSVVRALLAGLPENWTLATEGAGTWSPFDVIGHLIHGERTDWIPRVRHLLAHGDAIAFEPFDREAMLRDSRGKSLNELLDSFALLRERNLQELRSLGLAGSDMTLRGKHPELGSVTLGQLLATWVAHDLTHLVQIERVMARRYTSAVGPWRAYLGVLRPGDQRSG